MAKKVNKLDNSLIMNILCSLIIAFVLMAPERSHGQSMSIKGLTINAEHSELLLSEGKIVLSGNVQIIANKHYIQAQKASILKNENKILAQGDVIIKSPDLNVEAEEINFNYKTKTGFFTNAQVDWGNAQFEGERVERISDTEFIATKSKFTTCSKDCSPLWKFSGKKINAKKEGYAAITSPVFRIKNIPVFALPKIWLPIKSKRQTGFLAPSIEFSSSGGLTIEESLFITAGRSFDFTLTPKLYEKRGFKFINEMRFVLSDKIKGDMSAGFIRDKAFKEDLEQEKASNKNRGFGIYNHEAEFFNGLQSKANLVFVNDLRYVRDFDEEIDEHGKSSIESKLSLYRPYKDYYAGMQVVHNKNLLKQDSFADNKDAQHKLPEVFLSLTSKEIPQLNLNYGLDINYLHIYSTEPDFADITVDANKNFDPNEDILKTGQRAIINPKVFLPIKLGKFFNIVPKLSYSEYFYKFNAESNDPTYSQNTNTSYMQFDVATQTYFSRIYNRKNKAYRHEIEPEVTFSSGSITKDTDHPFFGDFAERQYDRRFENISDTDLDTGQRVQFDYLDRLTNNRIIELGLTQRLIRKTIEYNEVNYKQILYFKISQFYDFKEKEREEEDPEPWSDISARFNLKYDKFQFHTDLLFLPYERRMNNSTRLRYHHDKNYFYTFGFTQSFQPSDISLPGQKEQIVYKYSDRNELLNIGLGLKNKSLRLNGTLDYSTINNELQSWNYVLSWLPPGDCIELSFAHRRRIDSDETFKINFKLLFGEI